MTAVLIVVSACSASPPVGTARPAASSIVARVRSGTATVSASPGLARLPDGGMTIVIRHAATDHGKPDAEPVDLDDCATQRNLSAQGRADARTIGQAFRRAGMRVGSVWASPYCRSRDTAELALGRAEVVHGLERLYPQPDQRAQQRLNELIRRRAPQSGGRRRARGRGRGRPTRRGRLRPGAGSGARRSAGVWPRPGGRDRRAGR
ncbi:histidine phosphatase family protein [Nonomuraea polychroma]|uniref:histidine phosphatase family protein n=1 Tax=Nonomuraea polychroma TaxID=46176 RepID=UPI003D8AFDA0